MVKVLQKELLMMLVSSSEENFFVICNKSIAAKIDEKLGNQVASKKAFGTILIYELPSFVEKPNSELYLGFEYIKTLDHFYLILNSKRKDNDDIVAQFFDYVSEEYDNLIELERNDYTIRYQLNYILSNIPHNKTVKILDFGCGTGVSAKVKDGLLVGSSKIELLGYDISKQMLHKARKAGLKVLNHRSLELLTDNSLDAIFASYSLHFLTDFSVINLIWKKLKIGGIFTANFHKNIRLEELTKLIKEVGGTVEAIGNANNSSIYCFKKVATPFISESEVTSYLRSSGILLINETLVNVFTKYSILPIYKYDSSNYLLQNDIKRFLPFLKSISFADWVYAGSDLYEKTFRIITPRMDLNFHLEKTGHLGSHNIALLSNLLSLDLGDYTSNCFYQVNMDDVCHLNIKNLAFVNYYKEQQRNKSVIENSRASLFANSASYMGSKKALRGFLTEGLREFINEDFIFLDLMCGSGAFSSAISLTNRTIVSDAMKFCRILATVQSAGYDRYRASRLIEKVTTNAKVNIDKLKDFFSLPLNEESAFFHSEINKDFIEKYAAFCKQFSFENNEFKEFYFSKLESPTNAPYRLISCAYSNLYFGLRQSIEIDSYRFAIDQLNDEVDKTWALGALISTLSAIGNTYGGHFAQPKYKDISNLTVSKTISLIEQRSISISSEFNIRLNAFAAESEKHKGLPIYPINGPWINGLADFNNVESLKKIVYVDAPYTRDEYSRYYHVLETLIEYKYVPLTGVGRVPDKKSGRRFVSEFFTKSANKFKATYVNMISAILNSHMTCAWSYSDSAAASITEIIYEVAAQCECSVHSYITPYIYKAQGGQDSKKINEYLVIFKPKALQN